MELNLDDLWTYYGQYKKHGPTRRDEGMFDGGPTRWAEYPRTFAVGTEGRHWVPVGNNPDENPVGGTQEEEAEA